MRLPACGSAHWRTRIINYFVFKAAILKFADKEQEKKFLRKMFFSGISEAAQANFNWALIFWFLFYQEKRNPPEAFLAAAPRLRWASKDAKIIKITNHK